MFEAHVDMRYAVLVRSCLTCTARARHPNGLFVICQKPPDLLWGPSELRKRNGWGGPEQEADGRKLDDDERALVTGSG
jgi:hypothetical protein